ncbi:RagB/SusD family nutrient uptake outer membrane protein [Chitinophaga agrisoli]|uniref:RagB/SusD family nutrient uptake outer membrane protein n=1 Tax=Chitinophaga agrisoli TaxID=2607653 RepID=A0A5B2VLB0_9BACT|nr:RagB/SusD family nutrient uptake outer membrane protein [Chitinophaga agrisoli]KAA2238979.1 RagB/SusD family nutrient uptake outer membrane protein [Chitinophaga agrisoli]
MKRNHHYNMLRRYAAFIACALLISSCKKYLDIPLPLDVIAGDAAYTNDQSSAAVLNNVYASMLTTNEGADAVFDGKSTAYSSGLYTDELQAIGLPTATERLYYQNNIQAVNTGGAWTKLYKGIYNLNLAIEGITRASSVNLHYREQWLGEAYFMRALLHFYLVNLYGDCVLAITSDYRVNSVLPRTTPQAVYVQIIKDLQQAQGLLSDDYKDGKGLTTTDKGRPNKAAATALLARVYLYTSDWNNAEIQASAVIGNSRYQLPPLAQVFLKASTETIWALAPGQGAFVRDYSAYNSGMAPLVPTFPSNGVGVAMSDNLANTFEPGDQRLSAWTRVSSDTGSTPRTYRFPDKYKTNVHDVEYIVVLRLAEQYLIRAEARVKLNKLSNAQADLNIVRARAGLAGTPATSPNELLNAIEKERRTELFTEAGHRLFDLRRTDRLNALMTILTPQKGGTGWQQYMQWWPIPTNDIFANPNLVQTAGYQ